MKMTTLATILAVLVGCTPAIPEEESAQMSTFYTKHIKDNSYKVCIRGVSHLYLAAGNASHTILLLDPQTSRVVPCKEAQQ